VGVAVRVDAAPPETQTEIEGVGLADPQLADQTGRSADLDAQAKFARIADLGRVCRLPGNGKQQNGAQRGVKCRFHGPYSTHEPVGLIIRLITVCAAFCVALGAGNAMAAGDPDTLPPAPGVPLEQRAIQVAGGVEKTVDAAAGRARGLTIVDLSDGWVPLVLADQTGPKGTILENPYRSIYTGLASDRGDGDGQPLASGERNYLDLYGVPPTLSVLRRRFLEDSRRTCAADIDADALLAVDEVP